MASSPKPHGIRSRLLKGDWLIGLIGRLAVRKRGLMRRDGSLGLWPERVCLPPLASLLPFPFQNMPFF